MSVVVTTVCCQFLTIVIKALACSTKDAAINSRVVAALVGPTLSSCFSLRGVGDLLRSPSAVSVRSCSWRSLHKGKREEVCDLRCLAADERSLRSRGNKAWMNTNQGRYAPGVEQVAYIIVVQDLWSDPVSRPPTLTHQKVGSIPAGDIGLYYFTSNCERVSLHYLTKRWRAVWSCRNP